MIISGIYKITCSISGKIYIGQTTNMKKRWSDHLYFLGKGKHHSRYLQRIYNKYGASCFIFSIELECEVDKLNEEESRIFFHYKKLNEANVVNSRIDPVSNRGIKKSIESVKRQAEKIKGKPSWNKGISMSEESKSKLSQSLKGRKVWNANTAGTGIMKLNRTSFKNGNVPKNKGIPMSDITKKKLSDAKKGVKRWPNGRVISAASKLKMSLAKKGKQRGTHTHINMYIDTVGCFHNTKDLVKLFGVGRSTIRVWEINKDKRLIHYTRLAS